MYITYIYKYIYIYVYVNIYIYMYGDLRRGADVRGLVGLGDDAAGEVVEVGVLQVRVTQRVGGLEAPLHVA